MLFWFNVVNKVLARLSRRKKEDGFGMTILWDFFLSSCTRPNFIYCNLSFPLLSNLQIITVKAGEEDYLDTSYLLKQASPYMKIK